MLAPLLPSNVHAWENASRSHASSRVLTDHCIATNHRHAFSFYESSVTVLPMDVQIWKPWASGGNIKYTQELFAPMGCVPVCPHARALAFLRWQGEWMDQMRSPRARRSHSAVLVHYYRYSYLCLQFYVNVGDASVVVPLLLSFCLCFCSLILAVAASTLRSSLRTPAQPTVGRALVSSSATHEIPTSRSLSMFALS